ncbi:Hypothetical protein R9X50_00093900 [Acrodontium crateriforme]|uniref:DUF2264 domain-containing protein n=1 Tax=Acrodontium crateriforme TaxID=150365 RepID=A0AAQ3R5C7_9PEZI|nr:Hypothetical protein R9X50_00093900 [Acrodontium crateriforme]
MAVDSSVIDQSELNPLAHNKFETRDDVIAACNALFEPLLPYFSPGCARVQLDSSTSTWDRAACDLEGWARPLFGIAPMVAGGAKFDYWHIYREGLKNGTDPSHPEYWGEVFDMDQRHVEATALGYTLMLVPGEFWEPLSAETKANVAKWLIQSRDGRHARNNHMFFRVFVDLGLKNVGVNVDELMTEEYLHDIEELYIGDGWYRDGNGKGDSRRIDYYNAFAMHYYGLLYAKYNPSDHERGQRFKERARKFAKHYQHWFADTGANVPFGRSLGYRHCVAAFWAGLGLVDEEALPWGVMKGIYLRNLRWWSTQPISRKGDPLLTLGYSYPNQLICERYNSTGSPWWSMKAFSSLALPADHPFWTSQESPLDQREAVYPSPVSGLVFSHQPGHTVLLVCGAETGQQMRGTPEKYKKFAYSSRFGFSVESDHLGFKTGAFDNMIAFSDDDGAHYRVREHCVEAKIRGNDLYSLWYPWADVKVETWLFPKGAWHVRVHRITSPRKLLSVEGGFAAPRTDFNGDKKVTDSNSAVATSRLGDFSGIRDYSSCKRTPKVQAPHGNTNVMFPRTLVPQLLTEIEAYQPTVVSCAVLADADGARAEAQWNSPPAIPSINDCEEWFAKEGQTIEVTKNAVPGTGLTV